MATEKVGIYRNYYGKVPRDSSGKPLPKSQWPKKRGHSWIVRWFGSDSQRYSKSFKTRKEADRFAEAKQSEVRKGKADPPPEISLKSFVEEHEQLMQSQTSYNTLREQKRALRYLQEVVGNRVLRRISARAAETYVKRRSESGVSVSTINKEITTLRRVFTLASSRRGYLPEGQNPFKKVQKRKVSHKPLRYVTPVEFTHIVSSAPSLRWKVFLSLLYTTGLRLDEACHLTWMDVDFEMAMLRVSAKRNAAETIPWEPKDHELRQIPLGDELVRLLATLQADAPENVPYVFLTRERYATVMKQLKEGKWHAGRDLINNALRDFKLICRRAGVAACTIHDFRRSCITNWARQLPAHVVRKLAGHSSLETTMRYYLSVQDGDLDQARGIGDGVLGSGPTDQILTNSGQNRANQGKPGKSHLQQGKTVK